MVGILDFNGMPILKGLKKYMDEDIVPFHMPGHKNNIRDFEELKFIGDNLYRLDNTEVPGLDNLHNPEEMIAEAEKAAARCYHAKESLFLVNGSTSGIYSMIIGSVYPGETVIVQRNCHKSVYMAACIGRINTEYAYPEVIDKFGIPSALSLNGAVNAMERCPEAKAIVITSPSYYGICPDIEAISKEAHLRGMLILVDEAHGAHFPFSSRLPETSLKLGADAAVVSYHKTLPALTQTALLNLSERADVNRIKTMAHIFQTTSPSYIFMASIDAARSIMEAKGEKLINENIFSFKELKSNLKDTGVYCFIDEELIGRHGIKAVDPLRLTVNSPFKGIELERMLRGKYGIQAEMSELNNIVFIGCPGDSTDNINKLYKALKEVAGSLNGAGYDLHQGDRPIDYEKSMELWEAFNMPSQRVRLKDAIGYASAEMVIPYPPGVPVLVQGEVITREIVDYINFIKSYDAVLTGIEDTNAEYIRIIRRTK